MRIFSRYLDRKVYELKDHLGNVRITASDIKLPSGGGYTADLKSYNNYYPFGMMQHGRHWQASDFRYGYNGMEKDDEIKGSGNSYSTEFRVFDPRLAKWLSIDPAFKKFPWQSSYAAFDNNPIFYSDPRGLASENESKTPLHMEIEQESQNVEVPNDPETWETLDLLRWKTGDDNLIFKEKANFTSDYKNAINAAASKYDIPEYLLAGIVYNEYGGDPQWIDDIAYNIRSFDHIADPLLEAFTVTKEPELTSFGNVSIQVRRAAETLGYNPDRMTSGQRESIINSLKDPVQNIFIAAKHLSDLRNIDFAGKITSQLSDDNIKIIATRYNRGPDLSLEQIRNNTSYGDAVVKRKELLNGLIGE